MTRLVIETTNDARVLCVAFEDRLVFQSGDTVSERWPERRVRMVSREAIVMSAYIDPVQVAERALGGPIAQWHLRDEP